MLFRSPVTLLFSFGALILTLTPGALGQGGALSDVGLDRAAEQRPAAPATEEAVSDGVSAEDWAGIRAAYNVGRHTAYPRSEERRVGKECRSRWSPEH